MYTIRADQHQHMVTIDLADRITTREALRALTQAFALLEAGELKAARVDVRRVVRGPGGILLLATALATRRAPGQRIALVTGPFQARLAMRFARFSGLGPAISVFESTLEADAWLGDDEEQVGRIGNPFDDRPRVGQVLTGRLSGQKRRGVPVAADPAA